ncbi:hypothetical protein [Saccharobesus litoralis]|nr:hypothetical protein [Saccharobesus litoralis]
MARLFTLAEGAAAGLATAIFAFASNREQNNTANFTQSTNRE